MGCFSFSYPVKNCADTNFAACSSVFSTTVVELVTKPILLILYFCNGSVVFLLLLRSSLPFWDVWLASRILLLQWVHFIWLYLHFCICTLTTVWQILKNEISMSKSLFKILIYTIKIFLQSLYLRINTTNNGLLPEFWVEDIKFKTVP